MPKIQLTNQKIIFLDETDVSKQILRGKIQEDLKKIYCNGIYDAKLENEKITIVKKL